MPHTLHDVEPHHWYALAEVRALFEEYARELGVDLCFQGFQEELETLPGKYSSPNGALFLLRVGNVPAGCVAVRPLEDGICELKRLYVTPAFRGTSLGHWLLDAALDRARSLGYAKMRLDTLRKLETAGKMYRRRGFHLIGAYNANPIGDVEYMELDLETAVQGLSS